MSPIKEYLYISRIITPLGPIYIASCNEGLVAVALPTLRIPAFKLRLKNEIFGDFLWQENDIKNKIYIDAIKKYFNKELKNFDFPILLKVPDFSKKVLQYVRQIPYGEVRTYKEVAKAIGEPNSARAVGMALIKNPLPIVIPCHRVIKSNGELGGYQGGIGSKKWLLKFEGVKLPIL